jgi:hypothetical protein
MGVWVTMGDNTDGWCCGAEGEERRGVPQLAQQTTAVSLTAAVSAALLLTAGLLLLVLPACRG